MQFQDLQWMPELTAIVLTYNEAENIADCLLSLQWADRVLVFDSHSEDETVKIANDFGAEVEESSFNNFAEQRNKALDSLETDWVFFVDADERCPVELAREIKSTISNAVKVGWYVPRHNYIFGKLTTGAGWYPDYQLRLFRHGRVRYERPVHEIAIVDGDIGYLEAPMIHINYRDVEQFHRTQRFYAEYEASILFQSGARARPYTYLSQPIRQFWWRFFALRGYKDGFHGLRLCLFMAYYQWIKYRQLRKMNDQA